MTLPDIKAEVAKQAANSYAKDDEKRNLLRMIWEEEPASFSDKKHDTKNFLRHGADALSACYGTQDARFRDVPQPENGLATMGPESIPVRLGNPVRQAASRRGRHRTI